MTLNHSGPWRDDSVATNKGTLAASLQDSAEVLQNKHLVRAKMLQRNGANQTIHKNAHAVAMTVTGILDEPLRGYCYWDVVHGWVQRPLSPRQQHRLREYCPDLHFEDTVAWFDPHYWQRFELRQLSMAALKALIDYTDDEALLNYCEPVLDLLPPTRSTLDDTLVAFCMGFVQGWHLSKELAWYPEGCSTREFQRGRPKRGHWFHWYTDDECRIDGHPHCFHMQGRVQGAAGVRQVLKINKPSDLLRFDFLLDYWRKWLRFYTVDHEILGRFDSNRRSGRPLQRLR
jgi:hypothetical protein